MILQSYLKNRKQCCEIYWESGHWVKTIQSGFNEVRSGVPQGSVLGPLLFLLYINNFPKTVDYKTISYADDTSLVFSDKFINCLEVKIYNSLTNISTYLADIGLFLNISKSKYMLFKHHAKSGMNDNINISINNNKIDQVKLHTFLGIHLNQNFTHDCHIQEICTKISRYIYIYIYNEIFCMLSHN